MYECPEGGGCGGEEDAEIGGSLVLIKQMILS